MALDLRTHIDERIPNTQEVRRVKVNPYLRLCQKGSPPVYVQGGKVYAEGGPEVETLPAWFAEEMAKVSPQVRAEVGWKDPAAPVPAPVVRERPVTVAAPPIGSITARTWTCQECQQTMTTKKKGLHLARHRREAQRHGDR